MTSCLATDDAIQSLLSRSASATKSFLLLLSASGLLSYYTAYICCTPDSQKDVSISKDAAATAAGDDNRL